MHIGVCNCTSCEDDRLCLYNNSEKSLFVDWSPIYPDTTLISNQMSAIFTTNGKDTANPGNWIKPFQKGSVFVMNTTWEHIYNRNDTQMIFIFDGNVIWNTDWEIVARDYLVLQRYDLSLQDLQKLNWKLYYPPTEAMKDIKMYPPYQEKEDED